MLRAARRCELLLFIPYRIVTLLQYYTSAAWIWFRPLTAGEEAEVISGKGANTRTRTKPLALALTDGHSRYYTRTGACVRWGNAR